MYEKLAQRADYGKFSIAAETTVPCLEEHLDPLSDKTVLESQNDEEAYGEICDKSISGQLNFDAIMVSASEASRYKKLDPNVLSKLWKIDINDAKRMLEVTSQWNLQKDNPKLARNYGKNDRMLRYKIIDY